MKKLSITVSFIILLVLVGGILYFSKNKSVDIINLSSRDQNFEVAEMVTETASSTYAEIHLVYPKSTSTHLKEIFNFVNSARNDFWTQYGNLTAEEASSMYIREDNQYQMYIDTRVATSSETISYIISLYQYTGGAHGGTSIATFNYDAKGKFLEAKDVFTANYLEVLAPKTRQYFYDTMGDYTQPMAIDSGTEATSTNYSTWYITDSYVVFVFGEYQVGPYVLGIQEYPIPKGEIQNILQSTFK